MTTQKNHSDLDKNTREVNMRISQLTLFCAALFLATAVAADVPGLISYQGQLNDDTGSPVNGTVAFTFSIYDVADGGTALWDESQALSVSNGVFDAQLGTVNPIPSSLFTNDVLFLGIRAGADDEMVPRQQITATAFSHRSQLLSPPIMVPVGSIIAWAKSMTGTPALNDEWAECNGQVLTDPESPYDGQVIPDLNSTRSILKGNSTSGGSGLSHSHSFSTGTEIVGGRVGYNTGNYGSHYHSGTTAQAETAFDVVFVMRVK